MNTDIFKKGGKYLMLALDHRGSFKKFVNVDDPDSVTDSDLIKNKAAIIESTESDFSGVLLDPEWGIPAYKTKSKPFLLCLEKTGYIEDGKDRLTQLEYTAKQLKDWGASGVKLLLYFNPMANDCAEQLKTAKVAWEDAKVNNLPLFLEIVTYGNEELGKSRGEWVVKSLQQFLDAGIIPEVFKLEYPGDKSTCEQITKMLGATPWILLTRGEPYAVFKEQLKLAIQAGASGFLAGRAIWQEMKDFPDFNSRKNFLEVEAKKRFAEICAIALGKNE